MSLKTRCAIGWLKAKMRWTGKRRQGMTESIKTRIVRGLRLLLTASVIVCVLATQPPNSSADSGASDSSVTLTVTEADSIITLIDDLDLEVRLLRIDLRHAHRTAVLDSTLMAQRIMLQRQAYEAIIDIHKSEKEHFIVRALKHPAIWFMVGAYAGLQVVR